jgi:hypothetical protein
MSRSVRCIVVTHATWLLLLGPGQARQSCAAPPMPHVRVANARIRQLISEGRRRSPTFKGVFDKVERSDLIVYIEMTSSAPPDVDAWLQYEGKSRVNRFLRVFVRVPTSAEAIIVLVAHELQHAGEVANAPEVRDQHSLEALYQRVGDWAGEGWDSAAARQVSADVRQELHASAASGPVARKRPWDPQVPAQPGSGSQAG